MSTRRKPPSRNPRRVGDGVAVSAGMRVEASNRHHARLPEPRPGEHQWCMFGVWRLSEASARDALNPAAQVLLDVENLLTLEGPGCLTCEQTYTQAAGKPCPGDPNPAGDTRDRA